jgi:hypothetical protein
MPHTETAAELLREEFPEPVWTVEGLLQQGSTHLLVGKSKVGKSRFALTLCVAVATGGRVLGKLAATQGDVLYLALEDGKRRLQKRILAMVGGDLSVDVSRLHYWVKWAPLDDGGLEDLVAWLDAHPACGLVIIDTLVKVRSVKPNPNQQLYDIDYQTLAPLTELAHERNVGVLIVHHSRKAAAEDAMDEISGSTGLPAAVDGAMVLQRKRHDNNGVLHVFDRDMGDQELALQVDVASGGWLLVGTADEAGEMRLSSERAEIIAALRTFGRAQRPRDIADAIGKPPATVTMLMYRMLQDGQLRQPSYGLYEPVAGANYDRQQGNYDRNQQPADHSSGPFFADRDHTDHTDHSERKNGLFTDHTSPFSDHSSGSRDHTSGPPPGSMIGMIGMIGESQKYTDQVIAAVKSGGGRLFINSAGGLTVDPPKDPPAWLDQALLQLQQPLLEWLRANGGAV